MQLLNMMPLVSNRTPYPNYLSNGRVQTCPPDITHTSIGKRAVGFQLKDFLVFRIVPCANFNIYYSLIVLRPPPHLENSGSTTVHVSQAKINILSEEDDRKGNHIIFGAKLFYFFLYIS